MPRRPRTTDESAVADVVRSQRRRLDKLEMPDGNQLGQALLKVNNLIANIGTYVNAFLSTGSVVMGGTLNVASDFYSPKGRITPVVTSYVAAYLEGPTSGRLGATPSSVVYKQDIEPANTDALVDALLRVALVRFRYIGAVEELGDEADVELGAIAEYFDVTGLSEYVFRHPDGTPMGIKYERLTIPLIAALQREHAERVALANQVDALTAQVADLAARLP